ncbi:MAG: hypothetical protein GXP32_07325 [Kiritimatiellaeota bacterium]|nr:hypothetical protein [Kiritimatiellota bacterium]
MKRGKCLVRSDLDSPELRVLLEEPEKLFDSADILKDSRTTKAGVAKLAAGSPFGTDEVFVKRFNVKGAWYAFRYLFREPRPFRVWRAAAALETAGIPTPKPIAAIAFKNGLFPGVAYLIRESASDVIPTLELFEKILGDDDARRGYNDAVCALFAKAHDSGVYHGDAKCSNIYAVADSSSTALGCSLGLWDLLSCRIGASPVSERLRMTEIERVSNSFAEIAERLGETMDRKRTFEMFRENYKGRMK